MSSRISSESIVRQNLSIEEKVKLNLSHKNEEEIKSVFFNQTVMEDELVSNNEFNFYFNKLMEGHSVSYSSIVEQIENYSSTEYGHIHLTQFVAKLKKAHARVLSHEEKVKCVDIIVDALPKRLILSLDSYRLALMNGQGDSLTVGGNPLVFLCLPKNINLLKAFLKLGIKLNVTDKNNKNFISYVLELDGERLFKAILKENPKYFSLNSFLECEIKDLNLNQLEMYLDHTTQEEVTAFIAENKEIIYQEDNIDFLSVLIPKCPTFNPLELSPSKLKSFFEIALEQGQPITLEVFIEETQKRNPEFFNPENPYIQHILSREDLTNENYVTFCKAVVKSKTGALRWILIHYPLNKVMLVFFSVFTDAFNVKILKTLLPRLLLESNELKRAYIQFIIDRQLPTFEPHIALFFAQNFGFLSSMNRTKFIKSLLQAERQSNLYDFTLPETEIIFEKFFGYKEIENEIFNDLKKRAIKNIFDNINLKEMIDAEKHKILLSFFKFISHQDQGSIHAYELIRSLPESKEKQEYLNIFLAYAN